MKAEEIASRYHMVPHDENGQFVMRHYEDRSGGRPASGSIYYYVRPGERTDFHQIDCDEYWCFNAGATLEVWVVDVEGRVALRRCGTEEGAEPTLWFRAGEIFGSRLPPDAPDGTLLTCITVPRFAQEGCRLFSRAELTARYPALAGFWE